MQFKRFAALLWLLAFPVLARLNAGRHAYVTLFSFWNGMVLGGGILISLLLDSFLQAIAYARRRELEQISALELRHSAQAELAVAHGRLARVIEATEEGIPF